MEAKLFFMDLEEKRSYYDFNVAFILPVKLWISHTEVVEIDNPCQ